MRRSLVAAVLTLVSLVALAPPGFAQAPVPKVTISGLFDQVTSMGRNTYDGNLTRNSDSEWYGRTRFRPDFEFAVGRVRAVLGIEIDLAYGQMGPNDGGFPGNVSGQAGGVAGGTKVNTNGSLDINTDVGGMLEVKWIYTEFPLTGKDSLLPFIPVETMARAGGQPFDTLAQYKLALFANGDFAGVSAVTTFTPEHQDQPGLRHHRGSARRRQPGQPLAQDRARRGLRADRQPRVQPTKGLDLKPLFNWIPRRRPDVGHGPAQPGQHRHRRRHAQRGHGGRGNPTNPSAAGDPSYHEDRYTIGMDARWRIGGFGLDPTFYYQWGKVDSQAFVHSAGASCDRLEEDRRRT